MFALVGAILAIIAYVFRCAHASVPIWLSSFSLGFLTLFFFGLHLAGWGTGYGPVYFSRRPRE